MNLLKKILITLAFIFSNCFAALVLESDKITDILKYSDENTLVIFDVDGVVFEPLHTLGNDPWAYYEAGKFIKSAGGDVVKGLTAFCPVWVDVREKVDVKLVSNNILDVLTELEEKNIKIIGLTARGIPLIRKTKEQFDSLGLDFIKNNYHEKDEVCDLFDLKNGVMFIEIGVDKGKCLKRFFEIAGKKPKKIVFIDDRMKNIKSLNKTCQELSIDFVGIRYSATDNSVENFDGKVGDIQLYFLNEYGYFLNDDQAKDMFMFFENLIENGGDFDRQI